MNKGYGKKVTMQGEKGQRAFCTKCRKETGYALDKTPVIKTVQGKEHRFLITKAYCKECGCEVGVKGLLGHNAKEIDEQFRKAEDIISVDEIKELCEIYSSEKTRLYKRLGFGKTAIARYLAGQIPPKERSDAMRAALAEKGE